MISQKAQSQHQTLLVIHTELQRLRAGLPVYASWRIQELRTAVRRYRALLLWLLDSGLSRLPVKQLKESLAAIERDLDEALATGHWKPFNRAVTALGWDIDELMKYLPDNSTATDRRASDLEAAN